MPKWRPGMTLADAAVWLKATIPELSEVDFSGADPAAIEEVIQTLDKLAREFPGAAKTMKKVVVIDLPDSIYAQVTSNSTADKTEGMFLSKKWFHDARYIRRRLSREEHEKWCPPETGNLRGLIAHEFGHVIHNWLRYQTKSFILFVPESRFGIFDETLQKIIDKYPPTCENLSEYGARDPREYPMRIETWVEAFREFFIRKKPRVYAMRLKKLLNLGRKRWYTNEEWKWLNSLERKEQEKAKNKIRNLMELLDLI